jgi:hypothetical protein
MKQKISSMRNLAEHLIACEAGFANAGGLMLPAEPVCDKLRPHLATLMGVTGFRALLTRALARATLKVAALRVMKVTPAGALECLPSTSQASLAQSGDGSATLIAELLMLLCAFIGMSLTLQLVREIWPQLSVNESNFEPGDSE